MVVSVKFDEIRVTCRKQSNLRVICCLLVIFSRQIGSEEYANNPFTDSIFPHAEGLREAKHASSDSEVVFTFRLISLLFCFFFHRYYCLATAAVSFINDCYYLLENYI